MLEDGEVPKAPNGGPALCHGCQRSVQLHKGFINKLATTLEWTSQRKFIRY